MTSKPLNLWTARCNASTGGRLVLQPNGYEIQRIGARRRILGLQCTMEEGIRSGELQDALDDIRIDHAHAGGMYVRTMHLPAGRAIVGKIHKHEHPAILSSGRATVVTEHGREDLVGPVVMRSPAGVKRAIYAHTDVVWSTVHATDETDPECIEDEMIAKTYSDFEQFQLENDMEKRVLQ